MKFLVTLIISTLLGVGVYKHSEPKIIFEAEDDYVTDVLLALGENYDDIMPNFNAALNDGKSF